MAAFAYSAWPSVPITSFSGEMGLKRLSAAKKGQADYAENDLKRPRFLARPGFILSRGAAGPRTMIATALTKVRSSLSDEVAALLHDLRMVCRGEDVAFLMSNLLCRFDRIARSGDQITASEQWQLLRAAAEANAACIEHLDNRVCFIELKDIRAAFRALLTVVTRWAEDASHRALRHPDAIEDAVAELRIFRNLCHNACLREEIEGREVRRVEARPVSVSLTRAA